MGTMVPIRTYVLTGSQASVVFDNIPQTYKTLRLVVACRDDYGAGGMPNMYARINGVASGYSCRLLRGDGASATSVTTPTGSTYLYFGGIIPSNSTASTFGNVSIDIPNYTDSAAKILSSDLVTENNAASTQISLVLGAHLTTITSAVTSIIVYSEAVGNFVAGSSFTLYGIGDQ